MTPLSGAIISKILLFQYLPEGIKVTRVQTGILTEHLALAVELHQKRLSECFKCQDIFLLHVPFPLDLSMQA